MTEGTSETKDGKPEDEPTVPGTEDAGKAGPAVKEKTVEVHMEQYNSQPESMDAPKTMVPEHAGTGTESDSGLSEETKPEFGSDAGFSGETSPKADANKDKNEENVQENSTEMIVIENITWISMPEYDGNAEGIYIFTPVITEDYVLADGVTLPEIIITVSEAEEAGFSEEAEEPLDDVAAEPSVGVISANTTWTSCDLTGGTVTIREGVTLTITGVITISGQVIIEGGGSIERGSADACFDIITDGKLTINDITVDGKSLSASMTMIKVNRDAELTLNEGCTIRNCSAYEGGAISNPNGTVNINAAIIEGCSAKSMGGAIFSQGAVTINGGTYQNNSVLDPGTASVSGGGFIYICSNVLKIYGGNFINNSAASRGGCIYHCGDRGTTTYLYGGRFEGNTCSNPDYSGSGAICNSSFGLGLGATSFILSGSIEFVGDGQSSGTDGIFLDSQKNLPRMLWLRDA